jgi:redox-regulated HSP33 family molecular chaperone
MRKIGERPLTGAEKQKRHRKRVKERLAEAQTLKDRFTKSLSDECPCIGEHFRTYLAKLGAAPEEIELLLGRTHALNEEVKALLRDRAETALDALRSERRRTRNSLLARLSPASSFE